MLKYLSIALPLPPNLVLRSFPALGHASPRFGSRTPANLDKVSNDGKIRVVSEGDNLLMHHKSKDAHHGGAAVVELDGTLGELGLLIKVIPAKVNVSIAEVANVLVASSGNITHEGALQPADEGDDLNKSGGGDGVRSEESGNTVGEGVEGVARVVNVSWKVESSAGHDLAQEGELTDTPMLDLNVTEAVETLLGNVAGEHAEGVEEAKGRLGAELVLEGGEGRGGLRHGGRGEGGGGANEGSNDGRLHDWSGR